MVIVFCAAVDVFGLRSAKIGWILRIHEGEREDSFFDGFESRSCWNVIVDSDILE